MTKRQQNLLKLSRICLINRLLNSRWWKDAECLAIQRQRHDDLGQYLLERELLAEDYLKNKGK